MRQFVNHLVVIGFQSTSPDVARDAFREIAKTIEGKFNIVPQLGLGSALPGTASSASVGHVIWNISNEYSIPNTHLIYHANQNGSRELELVFAMADVPLGRWGVLVEDMINYSLLIQRRVPGVTVCAGIEVTDDPGSLLFRDNALGSARITSSGVHIR